MLGSLHRLLRNFSLLFPESVRRKLTAFAKNFGYRYDYWAREVMYRECFQKLQSLEPENLDVLEISAGRYWKDAFEFGSFRGTEYPGFDICADTLSEQFDLIIADQVFEHLLWPYRAGQNVFEMLRPGGTFIITTPFLIRVHLSGGHDCSRWTEEGLKYFLAECGFDLELIETGSWGNRACVKANFKGWAIKTPWSSLQNEPDFPVSVWAFARKREA